MRIGLLTAKSLSSFHQECIDHISKNSSIEICLFLIDGRRGLSKRQKLLKNWRRGRGGYMVIMFFQSFFSKQGLNKNVASFCERRGYQCHETSDPYSVQTLDLVTAHKLDVLILMGGYGIIKQPLLRIPRLGILSYHHGDMRKYRGMPPAFWELYFNEKEMGVTVQLLSEGLDKGIPVFEKSIEIYPRDTWGELKARAMNQSVHMMGVALERLMDDSFKAEAIQNFGRIYTLPNFRQWLIFQFKIYSRKLLN